MDCQSCQIRIQSSPKGAFIALGLTTEVRFITAFAHLTKLDILQIGHFLILEPCIANIVVCWNCIFTVNSLHALESPTPKYNFTLSLGDAHLLIRESRSLGSHFARKTLLFYNLWHHPTSATRGHPSLIWTLNCIKES